MAAESPAAKNHRQSGIMALVFKDWSSQIWVGRTSGHCPRQLSQLLRKGDRTWSSHHLMQALFRQMPKRYSASCSQRIPAFGDEEKVPREHPLKARPAEPGLARGTDKYREKRLFKGR